MSPPLTKNLVLIQVVLLLALLRCEGALFGPKIYLTMRNALDGGPNLTVHCRSKDDDLGVHILPANGVYGFNFKVNIWDSTLYYCRMAWNDQVHSFKIFKVRRERDQCIHCDWVIKDSGPCRNAPPPQNEACFLWDSQV